MRSPNLDPHLPTYPVYLQLLRVTASTVEVPGGATLYASFTQQLNTTTLLPRDREACFASDVADEGLDAGYYLCRLAGSYNDLPVYEAVCCADSAAGKTYLDLLLETLPTERTDRLNSSLAASERTNLVNLTPCQLKVFEQLPIDKIKEIASSLNATEITNLVDSLPYTPFKDVVTQATPAQYIGLTSLMPVAYQQLYQALPTDQVRKLAVNLTGEQLEKLKHLSLAQLQVFAQLQIWMMQWMTLNFSAAEIAILIDSLTVVELEVVINQLSVDIIRVLIGVFWRCCDLKKIVTTVPMPKIPELLTSATPTQLQKLIQYPTGQITQIVSSSTPNQLQTLLNAYPIVAIGTEVEGVAEVAYSGTETIVTSVTCIDGALSVTTKNFRWENGILIEVV